MFLRLLQALLVLMPVSAAVLMPVSAAAVAAVSALVPISAAVGTAVPSVPAGT